MFASTTKMHFVVYQEYLDPFFAYLDKRIFGYQPSVYWGIWYDYFMVQEFFHYAYFSYYFMIVGLPLYIFFTKDNFEFMRVMFNLFFVFYACFIVYMILPVAGGRFLYSNEAIYMKDLTETYRNGMFTHIVVFIFRNSEHWGAAFPSSHVAMSLSVTLISIRYLKRFVWVLAINTFFLCIATVFCHQHYFVDVLAGLIFGAIMFCISEFIYFITGSNYKMYNL
jgi:membrane-associated phospholipid phosphatase